MRSQKDRLHRVLVIGATPAGIAATNKLGEMGIPVTLVDPRSDLDEKLSSEEWRLKSGLTLNYAFRPGLLRILRNPGIRCVMPGEVVSLKHSPQGFSARVRTECTFVDPERCTLCGKCTEVCPVSTPNGRKAIHFNGRQSLPGRAVIDKRRRPLCQSGCPLGVNVQGYIALVKAGKFAEALDLIRKDNVLPAVCGRVCSHPCERECRRNELDEPLAIRDIKRFVADYELSHGSAGSGESGAHADGKGIVAGSSDDGCGPEKTRIAVIGSGPSGLAAAADLARSGYAVTVFEKEEQPGGLLRYGIGPYRLQRDILDHEIDYIGSLGVDFRTSHPIDLAADLSGLRHDFSAVIVATGMWTDRKLGVKGEDLKGVEGCLEFLAEVYRGNLNKLKENVAVIGDGNAAFDLARALVRLGAQVTIVSWFPEELIPADAEEIRGAREEGVNIIDRSRVTAFIGKAGRLAALRCAPTKPGEPDAKGIPWPVIVDGKEPFELKFDRAIVAIGQVADTEKFGANGRIQTTPGGLVLIDESGHTNLPGIYAAGDTVSGPSSVVLAMAGGRAAARAVSRDLSGMELRAFQTQRPSDRDYAQITEDVPSLARVRMPEKQAAARKLSFTEVALGLSEAQVLAEATRCLQCGVCSECMQCVAVCQGSVIDHNKAAPAESLDHAGVVIIADPDAAPWIKGEDVIRAYSTKTTESDVYAMTLRGFAAAAEAVILLGERSQQLRGRGLSISPPDPQLSPEIRLAVFACRCTDTFGWPAEFDESLAKLAERHNVEHVEVLSSACTPEGSAAILRAFREKGLTRGVLASCVCCPLDFVCSACTDQRSRLKDALFNGSGVSRAMVETCNLRGEVLGLLNDDRALAVQRFEGLVERSIGRAKRLKTLPAPARPYNFTTAVLGDSEAALKSAMTLAESGMEVFLFGARGRPLPKSLVHSNIHGFDGFSVVGISGTLGNFQIMVEKEGARQAVPVGAVILGEKSRRRIPYMPMAGLESRTVESSMQQRNVTGIPFFSPGATSIPGLFLANPSGINVSERVKGAAAAILAAAVMPRRPRQNKGYTVSVDGSLCRGCGRCIDVCPYQAVSFRRNPAGGWSAVVDEALCKGCGNCISVCPSNAADSPYRDRRYLEQMIEEILI
jgi:NADPH-dependent glutamate synthase beta subunit-like oxidoreductase/NAD-dependent dihydropyrimidine dehydrogenase PreA subunit